MFFKAKSTEMPFLLIIKCGKLSKENGSKRIFSKKANKLYFKGPQIKLPNY